MGGRVARFVAPEMNGRGGRIMFCGLAFSSQCKYGGRYGLYEGKDLIVWLGEVGLHPRVYMGSLYLVALLMRERIVLQVLIL